MLNPGYKIEPVEIAKRPTTIARGVILVRILN